MGLPTKKYCLPTKKLVDNSVIFSSDIQQSFTRIKFHRASLQIRISSSFTAFEHMFYVKHHLLGAYHSPHHFVRYPPTWLSLNLALIPLIGKPHEPFPYPHWYDIIHFGPKVFIVLFLGFSPKKMSHTNLMLSILYTHKSFHF